MHDPKPFALNELREMFLSFFAFAVYAVCIATSYFQSDITFVFTDH